MDRCPYYHTHVRRMGERGFIPCCRHKHAPVPCDSQAQEPDKLKCGGYLSRCQIPRNLQLDV